MSRQKMKKLDRKSHAGKNPLEKEAYKNFLSQRFKLDKTEEDSENPTKTDSSTFEREILEQEKPQGKSLKLRIEDFFVNNWTITIVGGVIVLMISGAFFAIIKQNVQEEKIVGVEKRVDRVEQKVDQISSDVGIIGKTVEIFKAEVTKDFQYIKESISGKK